MKKRLLKKAAACIMTASLAVSALPLSFSASAIGTGGYTITLPYIEDTGTSFNSSVYGLQNGYFINNFGEDDCFMQMDLTESGTYKCSWDNTTLCGSNVGIELDRNHAVSDYKKVTLDYQIDFKPQEGNSFYGCEILFDAVASFCYVVEDVCGELVMEKDAVELGDYTDSQGKKYTLFLNKTLLGGVNEFLAVRQADDSDTEESSIREGSIDVLAVADALKKYNHPQSAIHTVSFTVESDSGKGSAEILKNDYNAELYTSAVEIMEDCATDSKIGYIGDYEYSLKKGNKDDTTLMSYESDGTFNCSWNGKGINEFSMCYAPYGGTKGREYFDVAIDYAVDIKKASKSSYYGVSGRFDENTEFRIIDGCFLTDNGNISEGIIINQNNTDQHQKITHYIGAITVSNAGYNVYVEKQGDKTIIFSIRQTARYDEISAKEGIYTDVSKHIEAWKKLDIKCGTPECAGAFILSEGGSGFADIIKNKVVFAEKLENTSELITDTDTIRNGDIYYKVAKDNSNDKAILDIGDDGSFNASWKNTMPVKMVIGKKYGGKKIDELKNITLSTAGSIIEYDKYLANFIVSGTCNDSKLSFNIVTAMDNFDYSGMYLGTFYDGDVQYSVYVSTDEKGRTALWSVTSNRYVYEFDRNINISNHLEQYRKLGFDIDTIDYAEAGIFVSDGFGKCSVSKCAFSENADVPGKISMNNTRQRYLHADDYDINLFTQADNALDFTYNGNGTFDCDCHSDLECNVMVGKENSAKCCYSDIDNTSIDYSIQFSPDETGYSSFGAEIWFDKPNIELNIVEGYNKFFSAGLEKGGTITVDGVKYDIYSDNYNALKYDLFVGGPHYRFWCVRQDNLYKKAGETINGSINVLGIVKAMEKIKENDSLGGVEFEIETFDANCSAKVLKNDIIINKVKKDIKGDFNDDGIVDSFDLIIAKNLLLQDMVDSYSDINGNNTFDIGDIVLLQKFLLGKIDKL